MTWSARAQELSYRNILLMFIGGSLLTSCTGLLDRPESAASPPTPETAVAPTSDAIELPVPPEAQADDVMVRPPEILCQPVEVEDTSFASGSAEIVGVPPAATQAVSQLVELRRLQADASITIIGHTDKIPSNFPGGNEGLSRARALAVRDVVVFLGIDASWVRDAYGVADTRPVADGDEPASLSRNRRVEILFNC